MHVVDSNTTQCGKQRFDKQAVTNEGSPKLNVHLKNHGRTGNLTLKMYKLDVVNKFNRQDVTTQGRVDAFT